GAVLAGARVATRDVLLLLAIPLDAVARDDLDRLAAGGSAAAEADRLRTRIRCLHHREHGQSGAEEDGHRLHGTGFFFVSVFFWSFLAPAAIGRISRRGWPVSRTCWPRL